MSDEIEIQVEEQEDYIEAIKKIKENSVPKDQYDKLKEENKKLLESLVNGEQLDIEDNKADINELRKTLFSEDCELSNLEYAEKALELRDELIAQGKPDPFLPFGSKTIPTNEDVAAADRVAEVLKECIEYADGDSTLFTNELQRRTVDTVPSRKKK